MTWYSIERSLHDYEARLPSRLNAEELEELRLANLMLRCEGNDPPDAYLAPVLINNLRRSLGSTSFTLLFTDQDLRPVGQPQKSFMTLDNFWRPYNHLGIPPTDIRIRTGYFMSYESELLGSSLIEAETLDLS
ncbi:hypothetical protein RAAC3_TM7C00001G0911 [Candidatus Saccharibacteria bacterium RAAC3_TM7_1]|nr:hypothetical protein RAAC3_TM7C00001G0911 [Candidatus Saccharibacteria bacterium RAAC3_TM7_1]HCZ28185.1 hypothetical protein [Candidatus Saccharibacteria bacterium]